MTGSGLPHEPPSLLNPRVPLDLHGIANHPTQHAFLAAGIGALDATPSLGGDNIPRAIRGYSRGKQRRRPQTPPERRFKRPLKNSIQKETKERRPVEEERRRRPREKRGATAAAAALMMRRIGRRFAGALLTGVAAAFLLQKKKRQDQTLNRVRP